MAFAAQRRQCHAARTSGDTYKLQSRQTLQTHSYEIQPQTRVQPPEQRTTPRRTLLGNSRLYSREEQQNHELLWEDHPIRRVIHCYVD